MTSPPIVPGPTIVAAVTANSSAPTPFFPSRFVTDTLYSASGAVPDTVMTATSSVELTSVVEPVVTLVVSTPSVHCAFAPAANPDPNTCTDTFVSPRCAYEGLVDVTVRPAGALANDGPDGTRVDVGVSTLHPAVNANVTS